MALCSHVTQMWEIGKFDFGDTSDSCGSFGDGAAGGSPNKYVNFT